MQIPFVGADAVSSGELTPSALRRRYRAIYRGVYVPAEHQISQRDRLTGLMLAVPDAVVTGVAASAVHGAKWVDVETPIEIISATRPQAGLIRRRESLLPDEMTMVSGIRVTTVARTAFDLARHLPRDNAVARLDALMRARPFTHCDILAIAEDHPGLRGLRRLRVALPLVDGGAESPRETWLRLIFIDAGLPAPTTQVVVHDENGRYVRRIDMAWKQFKIGAEYDGDIHLTSRKTYVNDVLVARVLHRLGWHVIHVVKEDRRRDIVEEARTALLARGWVPE
ncbi:MAG: hypothetical protein PGN27_18215 [Mycolicibacterium neoaurum]|uniref:hypothetical protein n=1 Tax=Mycolicibacterium neoaurum TaxID=1795 RepID=UPI002FFCCD4E